MYTFNNINVIAAWMIIHIHYLDLKTSIFCTVSTTKPSWYSEPSIEDPLGWCYKKDLRWKLWFVKVRDSLGALSFGLVSQAWKNFPEKLPKRISVFYQELHFKTVSRQTLRIKRKQQQFVLRFYNSLNDKC